MEACPICKKQPGPELSAEQVRKLRPFCSDRCKVIDLAAWASDSYRVPSTERVAETDDMEVKTGEKT